MTHPSPFLDGPSPWAKLAPGGIFCDPQIGCSDKLAGFDISSSDSKQFNQEFRIQSSFDGPFNFSLGANYTRFKTVNEYYVMRSEEHTSELQSLMRISYAVFCLKKKKTKNQITIKHNQRIILTE